MKVVKVLLDKYIGAHVELKEFNGEYTEHICIPMKINGIRKSKGNSIVASYSINKRKKINIFNDKYYVSLYTNKSVWNNAKKMGYESNLRFIGSVLETKDTSNPFAKIINMNESDMSDIKALDRIYKNIKNKDEEVEEE